MYCDDIDKQMDLMLDNALDPDDERTIRGHLSFCSACQVKWERLIDLRSLLKIVSATAPSESLETRVMLAYYQKHSPGKSDGVPRSAFLVPLNIPKPVFAMLLLILMMTALVGAFVLGRMTAITIIVPAQPTLTASSPVAPPSTPPDSGVKRRQSAPLQTGAVRSRSRRPDPRTPAVARRSPANALESFASISPAGTNYSTRTLLDGFEPLKETKIRVVRGEEQR
jgi:hypothetical protein